VQEAAVGASAAEREVAELRRTVSELNERVARHAEASQRLTGELDATLSQNRALATQVTLHQGAASLSTFMWLGFPFSDAS
jgi:hypothetical protein